MLIKPKSASQAVVQSGGQCDSILQKQITIFDKFGSILSRKILQKISQYLTNLAQFPAGKSCKKMFLKNVTQPSASGLALYGAYGEYLQKHLLGELDKFSFPSYSYDYTRNITQMFKCESQWLCNMKIGTCTQESPERSWSKRTAR